MKPCDTVQTPTGRVGRYVGMCVTRQSSGRAGPENRIAVSLLLEMPRPIRVVCRYLPEDVRLAESEARDD